MFVVRRKLNPEGLYAFSRSLVPPVISTVIVKCDLESLVAGNV